MDAIDLVCRQHGIPLIEDCSHAHGGTWRGTPLGAHGTISIWSLQGQKNVTGPDPARLVPGVCNFTRRMCAISTDVDKAAVTPHYPHPRFARRFAPPLAIAFILVLGSACG